MDVTHDTKAQKAARAKSSIRLRYQAEMMLLKRDLGGLEMIRESLGMSRRKICQTLMVDPSAWTRWTKDESKTPPHIYKALSWYLELEGKRPHPPSPTVIEVPSAKKGAFSSIYWKVLLISNSIITVCLLSYLLLW